MIGDAPKAGGESNKPVEPVVVPVKRASRPSEAPRADAPPVEPSESEIVRGVD